MPLIELLRPGQRAWLRKLRRRVANRELMRRIRADIDRKLLCPGVDLPIEAGTCGRLIPRESSRCSRRLNRRRWLLNYAFNNAEAAITALLESAALEDDAPETASASADTQNPVPLLDELSALGGPCLRWQLLAAPWAPAPLRLGSNPRTATAALLRRCPVNRPGPVAERAGRPWKERDGWGNRTTIVERKCTACV